LSRFSHLGDEFEERFAALSHDGIGFLERRVERFVHRPNGTFESGTTVRLVSLAG
jgi:hypothetical protein